MFIIEHSLQQQPLGPDAVHLSKIQVLTFRKGQYTTSRRTQAYQQLNCKYSPDSYIPDVVQCKNMGFDGTSYQWKCEADMDEKYRFGSDLNVNCEGFRYAGDEFVLRGSCALDFSIEWTEKGHQQSHTMNEMRNRNRQQHQPNQQYYHHETAKPSNPSSLGAFGIIVLILVVVAFIWLTKSSSTRNRSNPGSTTTTYPSSSTPYPQATSSIYPGVNPNYTTTDENYNPNYSTDNTYSTPTSSSSFGTVPTFVAGAAAGYALNSLLNRQSASSSTTGNGSYFNSDSDYRNTSTNYYNDSTDQHYHPNTDHDSSTTTRTAKGYGGTTSR
ncbi:hypothetical protein FDP41_013531 [Naegleria fowleri]|uniref:Store-operated calcium entry-associated regulatory factor n=1 Tax=Naegleria fowleri TaxID=5763 RepID=A0A6A5BT13_NAEFO|nr:uncharacterized protein FDP41_013531 [Naegleria fowleri]KAF0980317.1 hypothetical protein FDP41_013531 [Naegleria fowleri]